MSGYVKRLAQKASKLSKEQLLSLLADMSTENENLYSMIESLSTGLIIVNNDWIISQNNTIAESRLPFKVSFEDSRLTESPLWELIDDEDIATYFKNCCQKEITNSSEDFSIVTSGGSIRFITITITPLIHESELTGKIILVHDVTERKNQEVLLHRMENMANLTNLAAGMAHEIKNPLGAISIHIQLIQKALAKARENEGILPPKKFVEDHIDVVNDEIQHLNKLVMDFLLAVRPVKAQNELKEPDKILQSITDFFKPEFNKSGTDFTFIPSGCNKKVMIDEKLFRDAVINIAQNSLAAIKSRFPECKDFVLKGENPNFFGKFSIQSVVCDNKYFIRLSDNGCGMDSQTLSKIFEPYFTTKANGTGLGMTMVYKIIKEFSGEISVDSKVMEGTTFTLTLPIPQKDAKLIGQGQ